MFLPTSDGIGEIAEASATLAWWQAVFPVVTHVAALPLLYHALFVIKWYLYGAVFLIGTPISIWYHVCLSWPSTCMALPVGIYQQHDNIWATMALVVNFFAILRLYTHPWIVVVLLANLALVIFVTLATPGSIVLQLVVLHLQLMTLFFKAVFVDTAHAAHSSKQRDIAMDSCGRIHWRKLAIGSLLVVLGIGFFMIEMPRLYWFTHSFWHILVYMGSYVVLLAVTNDMVQSMHTPELD